ncbi:MAG TPA: hydantoinase/oxoprolinase family protein [Acidimicrobiia bacterium]|nr:hydantoinase/oxoprolinase family protein [Acidimicrobiia bacterium]
MSYRIGIDVGGTFTDLVLLDPDGGITLEKTPTTPDDQSEGVLEGIGRLAASVGLGGAAELLARTDAIVHGTTTGDNTMIQMSGAPTGLIVTEGFRDEIEMRRCYKEDIWDPTLAGPEPIARRRVRLEVAERITAEGEVDTPLDEAAVRAAARRLRAFGITSIAVVFLHSYLNPDHELAARELIREEYPDVELISLSHEVYAKPPEFERTSTTLVNAYVGPPIVRYLARLEARLEDAGYARELLVASAAGGVATPSVIGRRAVTTIGSGPTGGVVAAARASAAAGLSDVVSIDMGGTSYDVCLIRGGRPELKRDWNWRHRYCIATPMVDIHAIGAGGGSVIRVERSQLQVGPRSAGAEPGPVSYGRGGTEPTVTDADLVLGRLDPAGFWGGRMDLDVDAARAALGRVGAELGLDAEAVALAAVRLVDAHMSDATRKVLSLAGADPRDVDLVAFGGMGGIHATTQARLLGVRRVLVPRAAPGFSALGLLTADHVVDDTAALLAPWSEIDLDRLSALADGLERRGLDDLRTAGVPDERIRAEWFVNLVYPGQTFDTTLAFERAPGEPITRDAIAAAVEAFHQRNEAARLIEARTQEPSVRGVRLVLTGLVDQPRPVELTAGHEKVSPIAIRRVHVDNGWHDAAVYEGLGVAPGQVIGGPAVVQYPFTALVLGPTDRAEMRTNGDTLVTVGA